MKVEKSSKAVIKSIHTSIGAVHLTGFPGILCARTRLPGKNGIADSGRPHHVVLVITGADNELKPGQVQT
jgi:hypothetical protein